MLYEMLVGVTPFHSYEMKDLIAKINDGRYKVSLDEEIFIEMCLFLVQCLQMNENDRIPVEELTDHPFINEELMSVPMTVLNIEEFNAALEVSSKGHVSGLSAGGQHSHMTSRFEDTVIHDTDVILTTKKSEQVPTLLRQLVNSTLFQEANIDLQNSTYFIKNYDSSMSKPYQFGLEGANQNEMEVSMEMSRDMKENHFEENKAAPDGAELLKEEDVDDSMFVFPERNGEKEKLEEQENQNVRTTKELLDGVIERQTNRALEKKPLLVDSNGELADGPTQPGPEEPISLANQNGKAKKKKKGAFKRFFNKIYSKVCARDGPEVDEDEMTISQRRRVNSAPRRASQRLDEATADQLREQQREQQRLN